MPVILPAQAKKVCKTSISKITRAKWAGGVVQAVEGLLCKHEALNSNPDPPKKKMYTHTHIYIDIYIYI
jgi:hypothetical protein